MMKILLPFLLLFAHAIPARAATFSSGIAQILGKNEYKGRSVFFDYQNELGWFIQPAYFSAKDSLGPDTSLYMVSAGRDKTGKHFYFDGFILPETDGYSRFGFSGSISAPAWQIGDAAVELDGAVRQTVHQDKKGYDIISGQRVVTDRTDPQKTGQLDAQAGIVLRKGIWRGGARYMHSFYTSSPDPMDRAAIRTYLDGIAPAVSGFPNQLWGFRADCRPMPEFKPYASFTTAQLKQDLRTLYAWEIGAVSSLKLWHLRAAYSILRQSGGTNTSYFTAGATFSFDYPADSEGAMRRQAGQMEGD